MHDLRIALITIGRKTKLFVSKSIIKVFARIHFYIQVRQLRLKYASYNKKFGNPIWNRVHTRKVNEKNFRTDNVFVWQKRGYTKQNLEAAAEIAMHLDERKYLDLMFENGSFGVQTFSYNDKVFSRDLIDSCIELNYLSKFFPTGVKRIIDIGAGYGRFTYRALEVGFIEHAVCIDANPKATLVSNIFLDKEIARNKVNILGVDSVADLPKFTYDLAVNIHSFSEMSLQAVESWIRTIRELGVPWLFVVPNPPNLALNDKTSFEGTLRHYGFEVFSSRKKYGEHALESIAMHPSTFYLLRRSNNL